MFAFTWLQLAIWILITIPLFFSLGYKYFGWFFVAPVTGNITFLMRGNSLYKYIHDVKGMKLKKVELFPGDIRVVFVPGEEKKSLLNKWFGLWFTGFLPSHVHIFPIKKERENPDGKTVEDWIDGDSKEVMVSSLRGAFPRPFTLKKVELKDRVAVDILVVVQLEVVDPYTPVFLFKGRFFDNVGSILRAAIIDKVTEFNIDEFVTNFKKGEVEGSLKELKNPEGPFNKELIRQTGLRLTGISIPQYDPSDKELRDAMNAQAIAREKGDADITAAEKYATQRKTRAEADAEAEERLAIARGARVKATATQLAAVVGATPDVVVKATADVLRAEAQPNLTTLVENGASPVVPVGGKK